MGKEKATLLFEIHFDDKKSYFKVPIVSNDNIRNPRFSNKWISQKDNEKAWKHFTLPLSQKLKICKI